MRYTNSGKELKECFASFLLQNFKSYKDETTFDFRAMAIPEFQDALIRQEKAEDLLPVSAVYGPNGGGKTICFRHSLPD